MEPQGIRVVEINLNLANAFYYLHWTPESVENVESLRRQLQVAHTTGRKFNWKTLAHHACVDTSEIHWLFKTTSDNLDRGLASFLEPATQHGPYLLQPSDTVRRVAQHIRRQSDNSPGATGGANRELPEVHYGLFMGSRTWAENMLDTLSRDDPTPAPHLPHRHSLTEISKDCPTKHDAVAEAYRTREFSLKDIAEYFDMHFSEVSAIINDPMLKNRSEVL